MPAQHFQGNLDGARQACYRFSGFWHIPRIYKSTILSNFVFTFRDRMLSDTGDAIGSGAAALQSAIQPKIALSSTWLAQAICRRVTGKTGCQGRPANIQPSMPATRFSDAESCGRSASANSPDPSAICSHDAKALAYCCPIVSPAAGARCRH